MRIIKEYEGIKAEFCTIEPGICFICQDIPDTVLMKLCMDQKQNSISRNAVNLESGQTHFIPLLKKVEVVDATVSAKTMSHDNYEAMRQWFIEKTDVDSMNDYDKEDQDN